MTRFTTLLVAAALGTATLMQAPPALAQDKLKLAIGQRGNWDTAISHIGEKAGIFKKHGIELDMTYTSGSGETLQPVISNSVDIGLAIGTMGAIAAYAKGAPVRVIGAEATGAADYWYAKSDSGIKTLKDTNGKTIAFSSRGSSTNSIVLAFINEFKLTAKPQATGSPPATLTAVMTGQVDVGWAAPPFGLREMDEGKINLVAKATDAKIVAGQTIRVIAVNAETLKTKRDALMRYMQAYRDTIDYMYSSDQALKDYAEFAKIDLAMAKRVRDQFFPRAIIEPDAIKGLDTLLPEAVTLKFVDKELTKEQQAELFQVPLKK
jgi:NitT/TauT family transport system substrate-binding protein